MDDALYKASSIIFMRLGTHLFLFILLSIHFFAIFVAEILQTPLRQ